MKSLTFATGALFAAVPAIAQMTERTLPLLDGFPQGLATVEDFDGDGRRDFVVGTAYVSPGGTTQVGRIRFQSSATGASGGEITGNDDFGRMGHLITELGDVDGDGASDFGFSQDNPARLHVFSGATRSHLRTHVLPAYLISCAEPTSDLDLDGVADYLIGAVSYTTGGTARVVFVSGATGTVRFEVTAPVGYSSLGTSAVEVDDLDGDSIGDIALGIPYAGVGTTHNVGHVEIVSGATGQLLRVQSPSTPQAYDFFGSALTSPGDIDGDGVRDLVIGSVSRYEAVSGTTGALLYSRALLPQPIWDSEVSLVRIGDLDFDGVDEYLAHGRTFSDQPGNTSGFVHKIVSGATGQILVPFVSAGSFSYYEQPWLGAGDVDGDGRPELVSAGPPIALGLYVLSFPLAADVCQGLPNSTGSPGSLALTGDLSVGASTARLEAAGLPAQATTFFLTSRTFGPATPVQGSQGTLCLTGAIGRYVGPGQIQTSDAAGLASLAIDPATLPTPTGLMSATAGERWSFQAWHRDSVGGAATSNFTGAVLGWVQP